MKRVALRRALVLALVVQIPGWVACQDRVDTPVRPPNVLLIVVDTLRADHLGLYGYARRTSDHIDALGTGGWVFDNHIASSAQTVPSTLSLLLSMQPAEHGFLHLGYAHFAKNRPQYPESLLFLAEVFSAAGYRTAGFVGNPFLQRENGFGQGFERFVYSENAAAELTAATIAWLSSSAADGRPFFVYLHYFDVHSPYDPPGEYRDRFERPEGGQYFYRNGPAPGMHEADLKASVSLYDGEIAYVDDQIGSLLATLDQTGERERTLVVVTSDHGEEFLDHGGLGHGTTVYGELVRVPLILAGAGIDRPGRRIEHLTQHIDLAPSLLEIAGIEAPARFRGTSLMSPAPRAFADEGPWLGVYAEGKKLILDRRTDDATLFALSDRLDHLPLDDAAASERLRAHARWYATLAPAGAAESSARKDPVQDKDAKVGWSEQEVERLRALGYTE